MFPNSCCKTVHENYRGMGPWFLQRCSDLVRFVDTTSGTARYDSAEKRLEFVTSVRLRSTVLHHSLFAAVKRKKLTLCYFTFQGGGKTRTLFAISPNTLGLFIILPSALKTLYTSQIDCFGTLYIEIANTDNTIY